MNLLIIGASGFVGKSLIKIGKDKNYRVIATACKNVEDGFIHYNILYNDIMIIMNNYHLCPKDTYIIICAALTKIDSCYQNKEESYELNVKATKNLIKILDKHGYKYGFISTDAIFDGKKGYYNEQSTYSAQTEYGKQKIEIEKYILDNSQNNLVFRISILLDSQYRKGNILSDFYNCYLKKEPIYCMKNRIFCPTYIEDAVHIMLICFEKNLNGIYNIANQEIFSRVELAELFVKISSLPIDVQEKEESWFQFKDKRHYKTCLISEKLQRDIPYQFKPSEDIIKKFVLENKIGRDKNG